LSRINSFAAHQIVDKEDKVISLKTLEATTNSASVPMNATIGTVLSDLKTGSYFFYSWTENLNGISFNKSTPFYSFVKDHRYIISDVAIYLDDIDRTDDIFNTGYIHRSLGAASVNVKVEYSVTHEDFTVFNRSGDAILDDSTRYPVILNVYLIAVEKQKWATRYQGKIPTTVPKTYPNNDYGIAFYSHLSTKAYLKKTEAYGSDISLSSVTIDDDITDDGDYQLFS
jgi:hypothetical protein